MSFLKTRADKVCAAVFGLLCFCFFFETPRSCYMELTTAYPFFAGFCKFAFLATFGECLAQRILNGHYLPENFGLSARAFVWGLLGICITAAFTIFSAGAPCILAVLGFDWGPHVLSGPLGGHKILAAFLVSATMNTMFAPVLMTVHKISDMRITESKGSFIALFRKYDMGKMLGDIDWRCMWSLVLCRSIVFFWIPAHTVTFLLPSAFRVLFAAILGAVLGLILAWAANRDNKPASSEA